MEATTAMSPPAAGPTARYELRAVAVLAGPVVVVQLGMTLMGTVDSMMLGRVSALALAAGALGASVSFGLTIFPMGVLMALDPLVAQAHGAGDRRGVSSHFKRGLVLAVAMAIPLSWLLLDTRDLLRLAGQQPAMVTETHAYLRALIPGIVAFLLFIVVRHTLQAMSIVRSAVVAMVVANLVNVVANYALIFGHFGLPAMGVRGSGYATSLSRWVLLLVLVALEWRVLAGDWGHRRFRSLRLHGFLPTLRLGVPIGFQVSLEMWLFMAVAMIMGSLGEREMAAHQIALNLAALSFMVPLGISGAAATRVGNAIGRGAMPAARRSAAVSLGLGAGVMTVSALAFALLPGLLARLYTGDRAVIALAAALLPIAALFQVFDGLQVVGGGILRGTADTRMPAIMALIGYWGLGLPLGWYLAFPAGLGPRGLWWGLTAGLCTTAVLFLIRIRRRFTGEIAALRFEHD